MKVNYTESLRDFYIYNNKVAREEENLKVRMRLYRYTEKEIKDKLNELKRLAITTAKSYYSLLNECEIDPKK